ncbi:RNA polymerase sigma factor [Pedobacter glucosidilyticus]|uniref:RNA polymerase sigma factor n=1 Tax=Pedobacter glucosidilyticus TaxID=1122941 RepID=UPI00040F8F9F|nr:RNA polymerase sigma factor [Pedobacter glucosidilyticus]
MDTKFTNDKELIQSLKKSEPKAYAYLVETYRKKLLRYVLNLTKNRELSEDIVQNVYMKFWNQRHKLKDDFIVNSYLYRCVYYEFIDQYRKRKSALALDKIYFDALATTVQEEEESHSERLLYLVKREIENLPPKCKQTFLLSKEDGFSNKQIAAHLDVSLKCVEAHITKAFSYLRQKVG